MIKISKLLCLIVISVTIINSGLQSSYGQADQTESIEQLYIKGDQALSDGDYIASLYYFRRIIESDQWEEFDRKSDVYYKIGILEESQSNSDAAALAFGRLIDYLNENQNDLISPMYSFYVLKFSDSLERAGYYERAIKVLWDYYENSSPNQHQNILRRLIRNYEFHHPDEAEFDKLKTIINTQYQNSLGWELANLSNQLDKVDQAIVLYDELWPQNIVLARNYSDEIVQAYQKAELFDDLISSVERLRKNGTNMPYSLLLEMDLLISANQGMEALNLIEQHWQNSGAADNEFNPSAIVNTLSTDVIDAWINLLERYDQTDKAISLLQAMVDKQPLDLKHREKLGRLLKNTGRTDQAIQLWSEWTKSFDNNHVLALNAAEQLEELGAPEAATELLDSVNQSLPPNLAYKQGQLLLNLGEFDRAYNSFNKAIQAEQVTDNMVNEAVQDFTLRHSVNQLMSALIKKASESSFSEFPAWARNSLLKYGVGYGFQDELESIAKNEKNSVWYYHIANEAARQNKTDWAITLLESISEDDIYYSAAERTLANIYSQKDTIPMQRKAADLLKPALAAILESTAAIKLNETYADRLMSYAEMRLNAFQPGQALTAIKQIESASNQISRLMKTSFNDRLKLNRARALVELSSFDEALNLLEQVDREPYYSQALMLNARTLLALNELNQAQEILHEIADKTEHWQKENNALALLSAMKPLIGESLELFCTIQLYQLQGRFEAAEPALRQLAVNHYGTDTEEWARFTIGELYQKAGNNEKARQEWERLAIDVDHPVIHGMLKYELVQHQPEIAGNIENSTPYQELLIDFPNTLFSDLARISNNP